MGPGQDPTNMVVNSQIQLPAHMLIGGLCCLSWLPPLHVLATGPRHNMGTCTWVCAHDRLSSKMLLMLVPSWWTRRRCWEPQGPLKLMWMPGSTHQGPHSCRYYAGEGLIQWVAIHPPRSGTTICTGTWHPAPLTLPPLAGEVYTYQSSMYKVWKRWSLLQIHRHLYKAMRIRKKSGKQDSITGI